MSEEIEPYAPPKANLVRPSDRAPLPVTEAGVPRSGPLLQEALRVWRAEAATFTLLVLAVSLPLNAVTALWLDWVTEKGAETSWHVIASTYGLKNLLGLPSLFAIAWLVERVRQGGSGSFQECLRVAVSRWPAGLGTQILLNLALLAGFLLLLIPALFVAVATVFSLALVALRGRSGLDALHGSWDLVRGRWWPVFWLLLVLAILEIGTQLLLSVPATFLPEHLLLSLAEGVLMDLVAAFFFLALVLTFLVLEGQAQVDSAPPLPPPVQEPLFIGTGRTVPPAWIDTPLN